MQIQVTAAKFAEMADKYAAMQIVEKKQCRHIEIQGRRFIITGSVGTGTGQGWESHIGIEVIPIQHYKGELEPLDHQKHDLEVNAGKRERGYTGMKVNVAGTPCVCIGDRITFTPLPESAQLTMF